MDNFRGETKDDHPDMWAWTSKHPYEVAGADKTEVHPVKTDIETVIQYINDKFGIPSSELSAIGFCWGAWPASKACNEFSFKCVVGFHPSLRFEENSGGNIMEMMKVAVKVPHLYCVSGNDPDYLKEGGDVAVMVEESKHGSKGESAKPRCVQFPDMMHGWVSRGDTSIKKVKDGADEALKLAVDFLKNWM
jgi:dienelactone hydrolase